jgi:hypothetical protein
MNSLIYLLLPDAQHSEAWEVITFRQSCCLQRASWPKSSARCAGRYSDLPSRSIKIGC